MVKLLAGMTDMLGSSMAWGSVQTPYSRRVSVHVTAGVCHRLAAACVFALLPSRSPAQSAVDQPPLLTPHPAHAGDHPAVTTPVSQVCLSSQQQTSACCRCLQCRGQSARCAAVKARHVCCMAY